METWKPIVGYEDHYSVSDAGRVMRSRQWKSPRADRPALQNRILKDAPMTSGYRFVGLSKDNKVKAHSVHQLVMSAFVGPRPDGMEVNHKNGIKADNRLENLEYVTRSANIRHAMKNLPRRHTSLRGGLVPNAKLNEHKVREILERIAAGEQKASIARSYGVVPQVISTIASGKWWKWVT
jgi:hypothetical protein